MIFSGEKKVRTSITIDPLLLNTLRKLAKEDGRTVANYIEMITKKHIQDLRKGKQKTIK